MKKIISLLMCVVLISSFVGCGKKDPFRDEEVLFDITATESTADSENTQSDNVNESVNQSLSESSIQNGDETLSGSSAESSTESSAESSTESSAESSTEVSEEALSNSSSEITENQESSSSDSNDEANVSTPENENSNTEEILEKEKVTDIELIKVDGLYFPEIDDLYVPAAKIYYELTSGNLPVDWDLGRYEFTVDGSTNTYWRISDSRFDSVAELEAYLNAYFTEDFIKTFYNPSLFYDHNGHLYAVTGVSGENILFAGYEFKLTKQTTMRAMFDCVSYFYKSPEEIPEDNTPFKKAPEDVSMFNTSTVSFTLEVDESGYNWRFSQFGNIK